MTEEIMSNDNTQVSRTASRILACEIERRTERGHCPPIELLAEQAIRQAFGGVS